MTADRLMTVVSGISLADACRDGVSRAQAVARGRVALSSEQAAIVMGIGAHCGIGQVSNPLHTAKCSIARALAACPACHVKYY